MLIAYKFAGFQEVSREGEIVTYRHGLEKIQAPPGYVDLRME